MKKIIVKNIAINYDDQGQGDVILCLHGWGDNLHSFNGIKLALKESYRVISLDFPGFGGSGLPDLNWRLDDYVDFVSDFCKKLNLNTGLLIGHSFGGRVILKGIATGKLKADRLVLIGSAGLAKRKTMRNLFYMILAKSGKAISYLLPFYFWRKKLKSFLYNMTGGDYNSAGLLKKVFLNTIREDLSGCAKNIKLPTLIIWGKEDKATPLQDGEKLAKFISDSRIRVFSGAGHFVHQEKTKEVIQEIINFYV